MGQKVEVLQIRLDRESKRRVGLLADTLGLTPSAVARQALKREWQRTLRQFPELTGNRVHAGGDA